MNSKFTLTLLLGMLVIFASSARATTIRTPSGYGVLSDHQTSAAPSTGSSIVTDALYQCQFGGTPCPVDLGSCSTVSSDTTDTGPAPCFDLFLTISPTVQPGTEINVTLPGFTDPSDQFGLLECASDPTAQGFGGICTPAADIPAGCDPSSVSVGSGGTFSLPTACIAPSVTFFLDETTNASLTLDVEPPTTSTPEPGSLVLVIMGMLPLAYFSRRRLRAQF